MTETIHTTKEVSVVGEAGEQKSFMMKMLEEKFSGMVIDAIEIDSKHQIERQLIKEMDYEIVGQDHAKEVIARVVKNSILSTQYKNGPLGTLFFSGPTGVGKTQMVKSLAKSLFGYTGAYTVVNCENLQESHSIANLIGSPKGYVGYKDRPALDPDRVYSHYKVAKQSSTLHKDLDHLDGFSIILFDEIEKAHPDVTQALLSLLSEGRLEFPTGKIGRYNNSIIIFTSNIGQRQISFMEERMSIGFVEPDVKQDEQDKQKTLQKSIKRHFSPEFIGRIHEFVNFDSLTEGNARKIVENLLAGLNEHLSNYYTTLNLSVELDESVYDYILSNSFSGETGARELERAFSDLIDSQLTNLLHSTEFSCYYNLSTVTVYTAVDESGKVSFYVLSAGDYAGKALKLLDHIVEKDEQTKEEYFDLQFDLNLSRLEKTNHKVREYVALYNMNLSDPDVDFEEEIKELAIELLQLGFTHSDIHKLRKTSLMEVLSEITSLGIYDFFEEEKNIFKPFSRRVVIKIVEQKIKVYYREQRNYGFDPYELYLNLVEYLTKELYKTDKLSRKQKIEVLTLMGKVIRERYGMVINISENDIFM